MAERASSQHLWAEARRASERRVRVWVTAVAVAMTAAVIADGARGHLVEALVFGVVGAGVLTAPILWVTRGSGWVRNLSASDYRRGAVALAAIAIASWIPSVVFVGRGLIAPTVFTWLGVVALVIACSAWLSARLMSRTLEAIEPEQAIAACFGAAPDGRAAILVLTRHKLVVFNDLRIRGRPGGDPAETFDVEAITDAEIRPGDRSVGLAIRAADREICLMKASPVQARDLLVAISDSRQDPSRRGQR